jgi:glycosyltransferase involved in cell wall biosynthesis
VKPGTEPRVTHLFDCADVGGTLVREARRRSLEWRYVPGLADVRLRFFGDYYLWTARRFASITRSDLIHLHYGGRTMWVRKRPFRPYLVHLHGSDMREQYADPRFHDEIQRGLDDAVHVLYATPDLADSARAARSDATYLPSPIDLDRLPHWNPAARPTVVFPSRWDPSKGLATQLALARALRARLPGEVDIVGLDWGEGAADALAAGVRLVPRMTRDRFAEWLGSAHLAVGQSTGLFGMSELQALGIGVPIAMSDMHSGYEKPPVLRVDAASVADVVVDVLADPSAAAARLNPRPWVERHHGVGGVVSQLSGLYRSLAARHG